MAYQSVGYVVEYELGALVIFLIVMTRYYLVRRFPNQKNRIYSAILWLTVANILLDVVSSLIIDRVLSVPIAVTQVVNISFYASSVVLMLLMMVFTIALTERISIARIHRYLPLLLPGVAVLLALLTNPLTAWFFHVDAARGYVRGPLFDSLFAGSFLYVVFTFVIAVLRRKRLRRIEYNTLLTALATVVAATLLQFRYPPLLLTGVAIAASVALMYFTIQKPDTYLDTTTGAFTYDAMLVFLEDQRQENTRVQMVAVKVNNMARINELLGIENGSRVLWQVCQFLKETTDDSWVFRMRGSCFVAVTRRHADYDTLCAALEQRIAQPWLVGETEVRLTTAVCRMATDELLEQPITAEDAITYLETAFMQADAGSGSKYLTAGPKLLEKVNRDKAVEAALREAIETGKGLELYYQPIWSVKRNRFVSAEVLLRFFHPTMGRIPPDEFVPVAESKGFVLAMDEWVVRKACAFLRRYDHCRELGLEGLELNLSALEFMHRRLPKLLNGIITEYGIDPAFLCFEITETAATESFDLLQECMANIRDTGCKFALDDFGTGYANISQVIQLPFSVVKLDKSLLYGPPVVLNDMVHMFSGMERQTVVEGVEQEQQAALAKAFGTDFIQGYYYARPMGQQDFLQFLRERNQRETAEGDGGNGR